MLTEEQAVAWEGSNKELFKQLRLEEWIRQNEAQGAEAKRIEEIRASATRAASTGTRTSAPSAVTAPSASSRVTTSRRTTGTRCATRARVR